MGDRNRDLAITTFETDVTPAIGDPIAYGTMEAIDDPLSCRGVVILTDPAPIVLASIDWIGTYNGGYEAWRAALADAAGTAPERVAFHAVHQHEAPAFDTDVELLRLAHGAEPSRIEPTFARESIKQVNAALRQSMRNPTTITHIGIGTAAVDQVASNRQLLGDDGSCVHTRFSAEASAKWRGAPEGLIDPELTMVSFWNGDQPVAGLSYYATHPQSYYRNGRVTCDFPGIARNHHQADTDVFRLHFTGAAGNIAAGKYNDGSENRRPVLADRVEQAMQAAWEQTTLHPIRTKEVHWDIRSVEFPLAEELDKHQLIDQLTEEIEWQDARDLAWLNRCENGHQIDIQCLHLPGVDIIHVPGEAFVEYQLAAKEMRPDRTVAMAAYADGGPGYIGTRAAYPKGGYEIRVSTIAPEVEAVLTSTLRDLLGAENTTIEPSDFTAQKPRITE